MRSRQLIYTGIAAMLLLAIAAIAVRSGDDRVVSPPQPSARAEDSTGGSHAARMAPGGSRASAGDAVPDRAPESARGMRRIAIPTELPDSPSIHEALGRIPDYRVSYTYMLGLMASYQECMGERIAQGIIYYYIKWHVDENQRASGPKIELAEDTPPEGNVTREDALAFVACAEEYLATHDQVYLPSAQTMGEVWGMRAVFPVRDSPLLKLIAEANAGTARHESVQ